MIELSREPLPLEAVYRWEKERPDEVYLRQPLAGRFRDFSWKETMNEVRRMAAYLQSLGLPRGSHIAILSKNCAHWLMCDLAIWMAGHASIPLYPTLSAAHLQHILEHSESRLLFVGKLDDWSSLRHGVPAGLPCVSFPYLSPPEFPRWDRIIESIAPLAASPTRSPGEIATIVYTSGTTGVPKGVIHPFEPFRVAGNEILRTFRVTAADRFFSYLPLAHVAERLVVETMSLYCGGTVAFADSLATFADDLRAIQPTVFLGVPRIWRKFQEKVFERVPEAKLDRLLRIPIVAGITRRKVRRALGLASCRIAVTGAAPVPVSLLEWYRKLGLTLFEAYGLTENFGYSHVTRPDHVRFGSTGQPWPGVETKQGPNGELLVKNPCTMLGYFKDPERTAEALQDGYLHTGDLGQIDADGSLRIVGRVKELFKTDKGKYVAPAAIELRFCSCELLEHTCVTGPGLAQPIALVTLSDAAKLLGLAEVSTRLEAILADINATLEPHERLAKMVIVRDTWSIEAGFLTPTLKLRRGVLEKKYEASFESWYATPGTVVWHTPARRSDPFVPEQRAP